jgi:RNA polymerase sigma factor (TIGR02999 family)
MTSSGHVTRLLADFRGGSQEALNELMPLVYNELRALAANQLKRERSGHTLQPTALVHEAWIRLVDQDAGWENRAQFFGVAATMMRRVLVDHARAHRAAKRGGPKQKLSLDENIAVSEEQLTDILAIDELLRRLEAMDQRQARIVELRCFGGLSVEEVALILEVSEPTVKRDWAMAKAWIRRELRREPGGPRALEAGQGAL